MARKKQSTGTCSYCNQEFAKGGMTKHLHICPKRFEVIAAANQASEKQEMHYHLRISDAYVKDFWLDLEMTGSASLQKLDDYLRAIWLECCGHLSQFSFGGWNGDEIGMRRHLDEVLAPGETLTHIYDFGTTSETLVTAVSVRKGSAATKHPIALMARNHMPEAPCIVCGAQSTCLCVECLYEDETAGYLCEKHAEQHPHHNYGEPLSLVNSPRSGMCGYDGPAEPPY